MVKQRLDYRQAPFGFLSAHRDYLEGCIVSNGVRSEVADISDDIYSVTHASWQNFIALFFRKHVIYLFCKIPANVTLVL